MCCLNRSCLILACLIPAVVYFSLVSTATYYFDPKYRLAYSEEEFWLTRIIAGLAVCAVAILQLKTLQIGSSQENHKVRRSLNAGTAGCFAALLAVSVVMTLRVVDLGIADYDQDMGDSQVGLAFYVAAAATAGLNLSASALGAVLATANVYFANEAVLPSAYQRF